MTINAFNIFDINPVFSIDLTVLDDVYENLVLQNHPDRYLDPLQKDQAIKNTIMINEAYAVLKDPILRFALLMALRGIDVPGDDGMTIQDVAILNENILLQEIKADSEPPYTELKLELVQRISSIESTIDAMLKKQDTAVKKSYLRYLYLKKLQNSL